MTTRDALAWAFLALLLGFFASAVVYFLPEGYMNQTPQRADLTDRPADQ